MDVENRPFVVVSFPKEKNSLAVVPFSWILQKGKRTFCFWPSEEYNLTKLVKKLKEPSPEWKTVRAEVIHYSRTYQSADKYMQDYCYTSAVETDSGHTQTAKIAKPTTSRTPFVAEPSKQRRDKDQLDRIEAKIDSLQKKMDSVEMMLQAQSEILMKLYGAPAEPQEEIKCLQNFEEMKNLNEQLKDTEFFSKMARTLCILGGRNEAEATRRILSRLIEHNLAISMTFHGSKEKHAMVECTEVVKLIAASVKLNSNFDNVTQFIIEENIKRWLRYASDRQGGRMKRMKKDDINQPNIE